MARSSLAVVFAGSGGAGAMTAGELLLRAAADAGYYGMMSRLFGPQVRGGEAAALVSISTDPVTCQPDRFDLFVALDWEKVDQFGPEIPLDEKSVVLADPERGAAPPSIAKSKARTIPLRDGQRQRNAARAGAPWQAHQRLCGRRRRPPRRPASRTTACRACGRARRQERGGHADQRGGARSGPCRRSRPSTSTCVLHRRAPPRAG